MKLHFYRWNASGNSLLHLTQNSSAGPLGTQHVKPKLLLLHGMGGTGALWRPLAATLEESLDILALDQRGHGKSLIDLPNHFTPLDYGRDVIETLDFLQFYPTWILGHSMGVRSAVASAYLRPQWVQGLILIDLGFSGPAGGGLGSQLAEFLSQVPPQFASQADAKQFMLEHCPEASIARYLLAVLSRDPQGFYYFPFQIEVLIQTIEAAGKSSVRSWLWQLCHQGIPTLALRGKQSQVWRSEDYEKEKAFFQSLPQMEFHEMDPAGHGLPFEQRHQLAALLRTRLLRHPR